MPPLQPLKQRGELAELVFDVAAARHGLTISWPSVETVYDAVSGFGSILYRVQIKSVSCPIRRHSYQVRCCHGTDDRPYRLSEVDFFAAYVVPHDVWYIVPARALRRRISFYVGPQRPQAPSFEKYKEAWHLLKR